MRNNVSDKYTGYVDKHNNKIYVDQIVLWCGDKQVVKYINDGFFIVDLIDKTIRPIDFWLDELEVIK